MTRNCSSAKIIKNRRPISELNVFWNDENHNDADVRHAQIEQVGSECKLSVWRWRAAAGGATQLKKRWPKQKSVKDLFLLSTYMPCECIRVNEAERCHYQAKDDEQRHHTNHRESLHFQCVALIQALQFGILETQFVPWPRFRRSDRVIHGWAFSVSSCVCVCVSARNKVVGCSLHTHTNMNFASIDFYGE